MEEGELMELANSKFTQNTAVKMEVMAYYAWHI